MASKGEDILTNQKLGGKWQARHMEHMRTRAARTVKTAFISVPPRRSSAVAVADKVVKTNVNTRHDVKQKETS